MGTPTAAARVMPSSNQRLGLAALTALVVGSMVGAGIFSLPQNVARSAGPAAALIGWAVSGAGMLMLAFVFQALANRRPDLDTGIYAYARAGFGNYIGFSAAWGYWVASVLGNASFFVLIFSGLGHFAPVFGEGNTPAAIAASSLLLWTVHLLVLRGLRTAAIINGLVTVAKLVPIALFLILAAAAFRVDVFRADFFGVPALGDMGQQLRGMMLVTVWVFIGIEGASIYSRRAMRRADVGRATVIGFIGVWLLLVLVSLLSMGVMSQAELAGLPNPSMAYVLRAIVGEWGATVIIIGSIISVLGALLAWVLLCAEVLFAAAGDGTMPAFLGRENKRGVPANALWLSNGLIQLFLLLVLFNSGSYTSLVLLAASMSLVPYFLSSAFGVKLAWQGEAYASAGGARWRDFIVALLASAYALWLVYAGGLDNLLLSVLLYVPGVVLYALTRHQRGERIFTRWEWILFGAILVVAIATLVAFWKGQLTL